MPTYIEHDYDFYEVINEFPIVREKLEGLDFDLDDIKEGESVAEYLIRKSHNEQEVDLIIRRLNRDVNLFLKKDEPNVIETEVPVENIAPEPAPEEHHDEEAIAEEE